MDLLHQSGYDSSNGSDEQGESVANQHSKSSTANVGDDAGHSTSCAKGGGVAASGDGARRSPCRKRPRNDGGSNNCGAYETGSKAKVKFARSVPHTPGNWAGHIFAPLSPDRFRSSPHDPTNRQSSKLLYRAAHDLIGEFESRLRRRLGGSFSGTVANHLPKDFGHDSSNSDDSNDGGSGDEDGDGEGANAGNASLLHDGGGTPRLQDGNSHRHQSADLSSVTTPVHISLSRPFYLQLPSIKSFVPELQKHVSHLPSVPVTFNLAQPEVLVNDDCTRSFLTVPATEATRHGIVKMIAPVNEVLRKFGQKPYYDEPRIHVSIASCPGDVRNALRGLYGIHPYEGEGLGDCGIAEEDKGCASGDSGHQSTVTFVVVRVHCTFGTTKEYTIHLAA